MKPSEYVQRSRLKNKNLLLESLHKSCKFCSVDKHPDTLLVPVSQKTGTVVQWGRLTSLSKEKAANLILVEDVCLICYNCLALSKAGHLAVKKKKGLSVFDILRQKQAAGLLPLQDPETRQTYQIPQHILDAADALVLEDDETEGTSDT